MSLAEQILRKLLVPEKEYEQHYVDLEMGIFDCRVDLTDEEIAYCQSMRLIDGLVCGFCGQAPEAHGDSGAGPMSVCPEHSDGDPRGSSDWAEAVKEPWGTARIDGHGEAT